MWYNLSLTLVAGLTAGMITPPITSSKLVGIVQADEIPSYPSLDAAITAMKANSNIFQAKVGDMSISGSGDMFYVSTKSLADAFSVAKYRAEHSEISGVSASVSINHDRQLESFNWELAGNTVSVTGMIDNYTWVAGSEYPESAPDTSAEAVTEMKNMLQEALNNADAAITTVNWTYQYEDASNNWAVVTVDSGTLTRGENSGGDSGNSVNKPRTTWQ